PPRPTLFPYTTLFRSLSPIDGIGPDQLGIAELVQRVNDNPVLEVILATNPTVEGEATAWYVAEQLKSPALAARGLKVSRIAHGVDRKSTRLNSSHDQI